MVAEAQDYVDAFDRVVKLNLPEAQNREASLATDALRSPRSLPVLSAEHLATHLRRICRVSIMY